MGKYDSSESSTDSSHEECKKCVMNDCLAKELEKQWKQVFPDATILPVIGYPSKGNGVVTITHTMGDCKFLKINGLKSKSPLSNNALFSSECSDGKYINLYEIMLPDIPGKCGEPSTVQIYVNTLQEYGLDVAGNHYHWTGAKMDGYFPLAIHHQNIGMAPHEFVCRTLKALKVVKEVIQKRLKKCN